MTVWVDNMGMPSRVGGLSARWSHLPAYSEDELHEFAARLGLKREWFQTCKRSCGRPDEPCVHFHYDVVQTKRKQALALGAQPIDYLREMGPLVARRRDDLRAPIWHVDGCSKPPAEYEDGNGEATRKPCRECLGT